MKKIITLAVLGMLGGVSASKITRPRGSYIFRAGDSTEVMGLMLSGSTLVIQEDLWGHRNILSKCDTGDFFGEPAKDFDDFLRLLQEQGYEVKR